VTGSDKVRGDRTLTPAVAAAAAFTTLAAALSILFVASRGGLQLPIAATGTPAAALASAAATSPVPSTAAPSLRPIPTVEPTAGPSGSPGVTPVPTPAQSVGPTGPPDPLLALPGCPDHPGCYEYTVRRGDSFTAVNDRYHLLLWITEALNPEVTDEGLIVVGQTLYLGRDPMARLDLCPDASCHLYVVRSGDTLAAIAGRYGITVEGIRALNPELSGGHLVRGKTIRLPLFA
jgi:LysM domain-containing protein